MPRSAYLLMPIRGPYHRRNPAPAFLQWPASMELAAWTESDELRRFVAGHLAMWPIRKTPATIDERFIEYVLALTEGITGRIIDLLRLAAKGCLAKNQPPYDRRATEPLGHPVSAKIAERERLAIVRRVR